MDGDFMASGLMAKHALQGEFTVYFWGQSYYGTLPLLFIVPLLWLFGWTNPLALFAYGYLLCCVLSIAAFLCIRRFERDHIAASIAALLFLLPSPDVFKWMHWGYPTFTYLPLLFCVLWMLWSHQRSGAFPSLFRAFLCGCCAGLALWISPGSMLLVPSLSLVLLLSSDEWKELHRRSGLFRIVSGPFLWMSATLFVAFAISHGGTHDVLKILCGALIIGLILFLFAISRRKAVVLGTFAALGIGFLFGNLPEWGSNLWLNISYDRQAIFALPTAQSLRGTFFYIFPSLWAHAPAMSVAYRFAPWEYSLQIAILFIAGVSAGAFFFSRRKTFGKMLMGYPLDGYEQRTAFFGLAAVIPVFAIICRVGVGEDPFVVRYLLDGFIGYISIFAIGLAFLIRRFPIAGWFCTVFFFVAVVINLFLSFPAYPPQFVPSAVEELRDYLVSQKVEAGYADYSTAYPLDFFWDENPLIVPYYLVRYRPHWEQAWASKRYALVLHVPIHPGILRAKSEEEMEKILSDRLRALQSTDLLMKIDRSAMLNRKTIGEWDVWIFDDPTPVLPVSS